MSDTPVNEIPVPQSPQNNTFVPEQYQNILSSICSLHFRETVNCQPPLQPEFSCLMADRYMYI